MTSLTNNITTALLSFFGLSSIFFSIKAYFIDAVQSSGLNLENSAIAVIFSLVGALLTALMKFMNSIKNVDDNIAKNVSLCEKQLEISNKNLETQNKILESQSRTFEVQGKILDSQSKIFEVLNKTLEKQAEQLQAQSDLLDVVKESVEEETLTLTRFDRTGEYQVEDRRRTSDSQIEKIDFERRSLPQGEDYLDRKVLPRPITQKKKPENFPASRRTPPPKNK